MNESLFGLPSLLEELSNSPKGARAIDTYERVVGPIIKDTLAENLFYKENLAAYNTARLSEFGRVRFPRCMQDEPDDVKDFLLREHFSSFATDNSSLLLDGGEIRVEVGFKDEDDNGNVLNVKKPLDDLSTFRVLDIMMIHLEEQLFMSVQRRIKPEFYNLESRKALKRYEDSLSALARQAGKQAATGGFQDVAGMESLKENLRKRIIWVLKDREKAQKYRLSPPNGMLLYGPPGCGKTFFAKKFAEESGFHYVLVNGSDLSSIYIHGTQGKIGELFDDAEKNAPTIICFDEFDSLVPSRAADFSSPRNEEVNEFLSQLNNCSDRGIFVIGTTNRMDIIDPAILRKGRLDLKVEIPAPDTLTRKEIFAIHLKGRPLEEGIDIGRLADLTDGYASSDIAYIVNEAAIEAALADEPITYSHLERAVKANPSSLGSINGQRKIGFDHSPAYGKATK